MVAQFVQELQICFSAPRLEKYRPQPNGTDIDMLTNYFWNIDLGESLVPSLHAAELAFRNAVNTAFTKHCGGNDMWFYEPGVLEPSQLGQFAKALRNIKVTQTNPLTSGRIVAQLMFGFWTFLISARYDERIWRPNAYTLFQRAFPPAGTNRRHDVAARFTSISGLRNRIAHYEPVFQRPNLQQEHQEILEAIGWISPTLATAVTAFDTFPTVYGSKLQVRQDLLNHLQLPLNTP